MDFDSFFVRATGHHPYDYQRRLALAHSWPDALEVPTGAGKTAAIVLGWLWRRRFADDQMREQTPRRLVVCHPMRTLTSQSAESARRWIAALALSDAPSIHVAMGGAIDDDWLGAPDRDAIILGTQDVLLSRALNRGFAMSRYDWPMALALLNNDVQWVFDEVQLMGVGASTSAQLDAFRRTMGCFGPRHSLWMSATLESGRLTTVDRGAVLDRLQLTNTETLELAPLLRAPKSVARMAVDGRDVDAIAQEVLALHHPGSRTLLIVNQVQRAQSLRVALERNDKGVPVALIHSRFRAVDRRAIEREVLRRDWSGVLVATQAIEAGVDISARTLVTDLAPWPSLVQRFGRCNRWGELSNADIRWIDLAADPQMAAPYEPDSLAASRGILESLTDGSPAALSAIPRSDASVVLPVIRRREMIDLFDTSPDLAGADVDVSPYIRDGDETDVYIAWRKLDVGERPADDTPLPTRDERCATPIGAARVFLKRLGQLGQRAWRWDHRMEQWIPVDRVVPGHVWLVDSEAGGYSTTLGFHASCTDAVPLLMSAGDPAEGESSDVRSWSSHEETVARHSDRVVEELAKIAGALSWLTAEYRASLALAARWHDAGKGHPVFQRTMHGGYLRTDLVLAKSTGRRRHERPGFRHEVASALQLLAAVPDDFVATYLVAAHHGRARLIVRARPTEQGPGDGRRFALGIWQGDSVPALDLGGGVTSAETALDISIFELGGNGESPGWTARAAALRDALGPFRLAMLEAVLRAADWRGSQALEAHA